MPDEPRVSEQLGEITEAVRPLLDSRFTAREHAITTSRKVIRASANAIRSLHRGDLEAAEALIAEAKRLYRSIVDATVDHPELLHVGYAHDAAKELSEASLTAAMFLSGAPGTAPGSMMGKRMAREISSRAASTSSTSSTGC